MKQPAKGDIVLAHIDKTAVIGKKYSLVALHDPLIILVPPIQGRVYEIHCETDYQCRLWSSIIQKHIHKIFNLDEI